MRAGSPRVRGRPGSFAMTLAGRAALASVGWATGLAAAALTAVLLVPGVVAAPVSSAGLGLVAAAVAGVACWQQSRSAWGRVRRAMVGAESERRVADALKQLPVTCVVHGALLERWGGDADHLVLGPCAVLVETKTGRGRVRADRSGMSVGGRRIPGDPVAQARRQAAAASDALNVRVEAVVCIVDATSPPQRVGGVVVCSLSDLPAVIAAAPRPLSPEHAHRLARVAARQSSRNERPATRQLRAPALT